MVTRHEMAVEAINRSEEIDESWARINKKRDAAAKKRSEAIVAGHLATARAKETYDKDMDRAKGLPSGDRSIAEQAILARYNQVIDEATGKAAYDEAFRKRYRAEHGHDPSPEFARTFESAAPGGINSPQAGIREHIRSSALAAVEAAKEPAPASVFNFDFLRSSSPQPMDRKATVAGKTIEHKAFVALKTVIVSAKRGELETLFSVTGNVDRGKDRIEVGAFDGVIRDIKSGAKPWPALLYGHQMDDLSAVMGSIVDLEEIRPGDPRLPQRLQQNGWGAVRAKARFNLNTSAGKDGWELASAGDLPSWSFAYVPGDFGFVGKGDDAIRSLRSIDELFECSLVIVPMNEEARTLTAGMKSVGADVLRPDRILEGVLEKLAAEFSTLDRPRSRMRENW
jgi:HK97 family phage prohead protease